MDDKYAAATVELVRLATKEKCQPYEKINWPWVKRIEAAIAVLEQAERWAGLIEAAGKVDKATCLSFFNRVMEDIGACLNTSDQIRALLSALPEPESQRREGHSHLVYDKARQAIVVKETGEPALPDPPEGGKAG